MGLLDLMTDPLGRRYKKKSMNERLGITAAKRNLTKTFIQPFNKLNPMWHMRNAKRNIKRRLGYNSEFAKAARSGDWGRYMKRKLFNSAPCAVMPFRESQFTPYDLQANPFDKDQTGPTKKGIFKKLSNYAAPGAVLGLALLASKKFNLHQKLTGALKSTPGKLERIKQHAKMIRDAVVSRAKSAGSHVRGVAHDTWEGAKVLGDSAVRSVIKTAKFHADRVYKQLGKPVKKIHKSTGALKRVEKKIKATMKQSADTITPMFRESYDSYRTQPPKREPSLAEKIVSAGLLVGGAYVGLKATAALADTKKLAVAAEHAYQRAKTLTVRANKRTSHGLQPVAQAQAAWATMKRDALSTASSLSGLLRGEKAVKQAERAAKIARFNIYERRLKKEFPGKWGDEAYKAAKVATMKGHTFKRIRHGVAEAHNFNNPKPTPNNPPVTPSPTHFNPNTPVRGVDVKMVKLFDFSQPRPKIKIKAPAKRKAPATRKTSTKKAPAKGKKTTAKKKPRGKK